MAKRQTPDTPRVTNLEVIRLLTTAAEADTVYRDLYLQRASMRFSALLSKAEYEQLRSQNATIENLLAQTRQAVDRQDWTQVQELTVRATGLRRLFEEKRGEMNLAKVVYEAADVAIDPFSPGFGVLLESGGKNTAALRDELVATLTSLAKIDPEWSDLYGQRRTYFAGLSLLPELHVQEVAGDTANELQRQMQRAAEKGDLEQLNRLAGEMLKASAKPQSAQPAGGPRQAAPARRSAAIPTLAQPFPAAVRESARALGFAHVEMTPQVPTLRKTLSEFLDWYTWHPSFPVQELAKEGSIHLRPLVKEALKDVPEATEVTEPLVEMAAQFSLHPYVNGGGARYLPILADTECVLIEDFPEEGTGGDSELLSALGLKQRGGLSRMEIEAALRQHGGQVLQSRLGLDPRAFRLVCVPFDVYFRVGRDRGWGQQQHWTHIDGYQIMQGSRLRALVGGDVRYGGLLDLCSISPADQREGVVARFAVVHRERLLTR
jgi:hypothetical protein